MEITYFLTEGDYLKFNIFHIKNSKTALRTLKMQRFLTPIVFIILSYVLSKVGNVPFFGLFITFLITSILWIIFYPKYFYSFVTRKTKKMIKEGKNDGLIGKHRMIISEKGITDSTSFGDSRISWSGIKSLKEDNYYFYLYNSSVSAYIIPKRELNNINKTRKYLIQSSQFNKSM
jgi:hypothetical protein